MTVLDKDTNETTKQAVISTIRNTVTGIREEWGRLFGKTDDVHWALSKVLDELEKYNTEYHSWDWAIQKLQEGKYVTWINWSRDSFLALSNGLFTRYSIFDGKPRCMGDYRFDVSKFTQDGWTLWEPRDEINNERTNC
jgi:hypothetical protein